jgi:hypothetical protein
MTLFRKSLTFALVALVITVGGACFGINSFFAPSAGQVWKDTSAPVVAIHNPFPNAN